MCDFLFITFPVGTNVSALKSSLSREEISESGDSWPPIQIKGWDYYSATGCKHCDCGTAVGSYEMEFLPENWSAQRCEERFAKNGLKGSKLRRRVEDEKRNIDKELRSQHYKLAKSECDEWLVLIRRVLEGKRVPKVGFMKYNASGSKSEALRERHKEVVRVGEATKETFMTMKEDVLYVFAK